MGPVIDARPWISFDVAAAAEEFRIPGERPNGRQKGAQSCLNVGRFQPNRRSCGG